MQISVQFADVYELTAQNKLDPTLKQINLSLSTNQTRTNNLLQTY